MKKLKRFKSVYKKMDLGGNPDDPEYTPERAATLGTFDTGALFGSGQPATAMTPPAMAGAGWRKVFGDVQNAASAAVPYASNIANAFRTPPQPQAPQLINPVTLSRIDLSDARNRISRTVRGQDLNADKTLPGQQAAAVRNANLAKEIEGTSQVSEQEAFLNSRQRAEQAGMNLNVESMNARATDQFHQQQLERNIAQAREQSQNLSNASDKVIAQQNEQRKAALDMKKMDVLSQMWKSSGVYDRMLKKMKDQGIDDPEGIMTQMGNRRFGGKVFAEGGPTGPGINAVNISAAKSSGLDNSSVLDHLNSILSGRSSNVGTFGGDHGALAMQAYTWRAQNPGRSPEQIISSFYDRPVTAGNTADAYRQTLSKIGYGPNAVYNDTPNQSVRMAYGGFNAATKPFGMNRGRATGAGMVSPFGSSRSINLGAGIPNGKFNPAHISRTHVYDMGGPVDRLQIENPDTLMANGHSTMTPGVYKMGGTFMDYPIRPKAIRQMDFAGIEHMSLGGIPLGAMQEDQHNNMRPTPGPDDLHVGMDIMAKGGKIHIKPSHKGRFTAYKARTGKTTAQALHSSDPHVRQMANFARNASKWKHAFGGSI